MFALLTYIWGFVLHVRENDSVGIAAGAAFFFLIALFPLLMMASWILDYFDLSLATLEGFLPAGMIELFETGGMASPKTMWSPVSALLALWSGSAGVWGLMKGVNKAYTGKPLASVGARLFAVFLTLCFLAVLALTLAFVALDRWGSLLMTGAAIFLLLFALYYFTPGASARPGRALWTAALAAGCWLLVSKGFEIYMGHFANYNVLYGSLGAFLGLALWVFIISAVIILGAELGAVQRRS